MLIIEDNRDLAANLVDYLEAHGHSLDCAADGLSGLHLAVTTHPDVIVLDLGLPGLDGVTVCKRLREEGHATPILMLTARSTVDQRVEGLTIGADDYLVKPVSLRELEARLMALVRRARGGLDKPQLQVADLIVDERTRTASRAGAVLTLTRLDYDILVILMRASPGVVSRREIERQAWPDDPPGSDTLRAHIHRLRRAIDQDAARPLLHTVHGVGYRLFDDAAISK
ncbi:DNA-binding response OmpR family regulator [Natronocella acetinitrilica]|uniref:DNA-binding response OmpR family regulator n=1 Tax=Natronocella acetinitrilica TaxID=414046 RepID=A0AAE3KCA8_9GAMM|nr:DNA-binding response OmpR family regulator [Natronocella acetinitrilica]